MKYRVIITDDALADAHDYLVYIAQENHMPQTAEKWWHKALASIDTLEAFPNRCRYAAENRLSKFTLRVLEVDSCLFIYRVDEEKQTVRILRMRHGRRMPCNID